MLFFLLWLAALTLDSPPSPQCQLEPHAADASGRVAGSLVFGTGSFR